MKEQQSIYFLIPVRIRIKLEQTAKQNGVTMSWIIRALIHEYRVKEKQMPRFSRPGKLLENHIRFSLKLYGDKNEILTYARGNGGEFSPFIRHLLELWYHGELVVNLNTTKTIKTVKLFNITFKGVASISHMKIKFYQNDEFRPKNAKTNLNLMNWGLNNKTTVNAIEILS